MGFLDRGKRKQEGERLEELSQIATSDFEAAGVAPRPARQGLRPPRQHAEQIAKAELRLDLEPIEGEQGAVEFFGDTARALAMRQRALLLMDKNELKASILRRQRNAADDEGTYRRLDGKLDALDSEWSRLLHVARPSNPATGEPLTKLCRVEGCSNDLFVVSEDHAQMGRCAECHEAAYQPTNEERQGQE